MLAAWTCILAAGVLLHMNHAEDCPALTLVQSRSQQMQRQASATSKTNHFSVASDASTDTVVIDFRYANLVQNNLGGLGPAMEGPQLMVIKNVSLYGGRSLNMEIESLSEYFAADVGKNSHQGPFVQINVLNDKTVDLAFSLRYDDSGELAQVPNFNMSFWDLDNGKKSGGVESVTVGPIVAHYTSSQTEFTTTKISPSQWKFTATDFGKMSDNPDDLSVLTPQQISRAVEVETSSSTLQVSLGVSMLTTSWKPNSGRTFLIGGSSTSPSFSQHTQGELPLRVVLQAHNSNYMARCRDCQTTVGANPDTATVHATSPAAAYAQFTVKNMDGGKVALMSDIGKFVARCRGCIVNGAKPDAITIHANDPNHVWAQFSPELQANGYQALKTDIGTYVSRCHGCSPNAAVSDTVTCHALAPPPAYSVWRIVPLTWPTGIKIAMQGDNGRWMSRCRDCQNTVGTKPDTGVVEQTSPAPLNVHFTVVNVGGGKIALKSDLGNFAARCNGCVVNGAKSDTIMFHVDDPTYSFAQFTPELLSNGKYALKADTGKYVSRCYGCSPGASVSNTVTVHEGSPGVPWAQWNLVVLL